MERIYLGKLQKQKELKFTFYLETIVLANFNGKKYYYSFKINRNADIDIINFLKCFVFVKN